MAKTGTRRRKGRGALNPRIASFQAIQIQSGRGMHRCVPNRLHINMRICCYSEQKLNGIGARIPMGSNGMLRPHTQYALRVECVD
ncbi:hypothetical protein EVAR_25879_1 [Eumeta japonica]|uniref:Uncharacterized protein n=1 Tax=Eumeta variegata TaxID=151549 RepID=A0A4C1W4S7_EUMVA|nr:hypothetical protein EVAR_25879_1 [Eumeta japonica]